MRPARLRMSLAGSIAMHVALAILLTCIAIGTRPPSLPEPETVALVFEPVPTEPAVALQPPGRLTAPQAAPELPAAEPPPPPPLPEPEPPPEPPPVAVAPLELPKPVPRTAPTESRTADPPQHLGTRRIIARRGACTT